jgi:manganese/iron transport system ATP-binding protein
MNDQIKKSPLELSVTGVTVRYAQGHTALRDTTFRLGGGTIAGLVGVNGSGKSTLFKTIMGFLAPQQGTVTLNGESMRAAQKKGLVSYVPQADEVDWDYPVSVYDVVMMGRYGQMNFLRWIRAEDRTAVETALRRVDLWDYRERQIGELSGGQKKRVFLARALAQGGQLILLDEPFTGVDVTTEEAIIEVLRERRDEGALILVSTHNLGAVPEFCDQVVLINRTVLACGPTEEVFTLENLTQAFGGVLRDFHFEASTVQDHDGQAVRLLSDDERPLVFGKDGHLEYRDGRKWPEVMQAREKGGEENS